ncbi:WGR domain-containing protein [Rhizobium sp. CNPSo 3464]|uniref:WGR domain-containing protein n=1 Tax=Rhizobium sp. CNPSo 3464 TaxID=3021406 RepID=UPI00330595DA
MSFTFAEAIPLRTCGASTRSRSSRTYSAGVVRHWGRIGTNGQEKIETCDEPQVAEAAYGRLERVKRRRGYKELEVEENR